MMTPRWIGRGWLSSSIGALALIVLVGCGLSEAQVVRLEAEWRRRQSENPAGRFGDPEEFGALCAFVCGAKAGYITGQNLLIDGGAYPGTL